MEQSNCGSATGDISPPQSATDNLTEDVLANDGSNDLNEFLQIQDDQNKNSSFNNVVKQEEIYEEGDDEEGEEDLTAAVLAQSGYYKADPPNPSPVSLPNTLKLVSAMKGSREKEGTPPKNLTVSWAADVYDPRHTAASHLAKTRTERHRSDTKKNTKNKQKWGGKPAGGGRGKDKKQVQKYGGSSKKCFQSLDDDERLVDKDEPYTNFDDPF